MLQLRLKLAVLHVALFCYLVNAQGGLQIIDTISWPAYSSTPANVNASWYTTVYSGSIPTVTGDAGFVAVYRDTNTSYTWWVGHEWIGVVQDANPVNTSALVSVLNYNLNWATPSITTPVNFVGIDADRVNRKLYTCTQNQWDCWEIDMDTRALRKIYVRPNFQTDFVGMCFDETFSLVWIIGDSFLAWVQPSQAVTYYTPNPPYPPHKAPNFNGTEAPNGIYISLGTSLKLACIFKDYKPRGGRTTPYIYVGASATLYRTEAQNNPYGATGFRKQDFEARPIGAGIYFTGIVNQYLDVMYLGSSLGLGVEVDMDSFALNRIFFSPGDEFYSIFVDTAVSFWITRSATVARVNSVDFQIASSIVLSRGNLRTIIQDNAGRLHIGSDTGGVQLNEFRSFIVQKTNCSAYTCDQCFTQDQEYCGICKSSGLCTLQAECPVGTDWEQNGVCPASFAAIPSAISADADSTLIRINGAFFEPNNTVCVFYDGPNTTTVTPTQIGNNYLICAAPGRPGQVAKYEYVQVGVSWQSREWGNRLNLTYYKCSTMACDECFSPDHTDCGWCLENFQCQSSGTCVGTFVNSSCPAITSISPQTAGIYGGETLTVQVSHTLPDLFYSCHFGTATVEAVPVSSDTFSCVVPQLASPSGALSNVSLTFWTNNSVVQYAPAAYPFTYYDCNQFAPCSDCQIASQPKCVWCGAPNMTCTFTTGEMGSRNCSNTVSCPVVTSIRPFSDFIPTAPSIYLPTSATIVGANFETLPSMKCAWQRPGGPILYTAAIRPFGSNDIVCSTPNAGSEPIPAEYQVWIVAGASSARQSSSVSFLFYDCAAEACYDCLDPRKKLCNFCLTSRHCWADSDQAYTCSNSETNYQSNCTVLTSVSPTGDSLVGGVTISLYGTLGLSSNDTGVTCEWIMDDNGQVLTGPSTYISSTRVDCTTPGINREGTAVVRVVKDGLDWTNALPFQFHDCTTLLTCGDCLATTNPGCTWCATGGNFSCVGVQTCDSLKRITGSCPVITGANPDHAIVDGGDSVSIFGGPFVSTGDLVGTYTCMYDGVIQTAGTYINSQEVQCATPRRAVGDSVVSIYFDGLLYSPNTTIITFFDCAPVAASLCSDSCTNQTYCGWCVEGRTCGSQAKCNNLWLPSCLVTEIPQPYANIFGNEVITLITLNQPLTGVVDSDLQCDFGSVVQNATISFDGNTSTITCLSPKVEQIADVAFNAYYLDNPLIEDSTFSFVNCSQYSTCIECVTHPYCGWCLSDNRCSTESLCPPPGNYSSRCPDLTSITPQQGDIRGGDTITVAGYGFVDNGKLSLYFDETAISTTIVNNTVVTAVTPQHPTGDIDVTLRYNNNTYAVSAVHFKYVDLQANVAATAGGVVAALVVVAGLGVGGFFLYKRKYKDSILVNIREPDYVQVAYGSDLIPRFKMPGDEYKKLDDALSRADFALQLGLASFCPATEQDLLAKSLVHIGYDYDPIFTIELLTAIIQNEVASCIQENTIFRGNSVASKMFKFYSRMTGIKYLWRCMARIIAELETLGAKELKQQEAAKLGKDKKKDGTSLLEMSMELDENKMGKGSAAEDLDVDTNILQLKLTCQKLFSVLVKNSVKDIPVEFRRIFQEIDEAVMQKFGSDDASFKAIGGFFFLRFVCPAITAPHFYGLLENPPNNLTQRQLVLISKTLQCLANMTVPGKKEKYMERLSDFISNGIPKVIKFYEQIRSASFGSEGRLCDLPITKDVKQNALATTWNFIYLNQDKTAQSFENLGLGKDANRELNDTLEELVYEYKTAPKKLAKKKTKGGKERPAAGPPPE